MFRLVGIGPRLAFAFAAMAGVTCLVVLVGIVTSQSVTRDIHTAQTTRLPASLTSEQAQASLLQMQLRVRGYLIFGDPSDIAKYKEAKTDFEERLRTLQGLARTWNSEDASDVKALSEAYAKWTQLPQRLFELHDNPLRNRPALRISWAEVQPRRVEAMKHLDAMLEEQRGRPDSPRARALLSDIVAFQSSFDSLTTNLMAFASSGELNFRFAYGPKLSTNAALWLALTEKQEQLTAQQRGHLARLAKLRAEISDFALEITSYVGGEHAYDDRYLYRTEAEPQAEKMIGLLAALTAHQRELLQAEIDNVNASLRTSRLVGIVGGAVAVVLAITMAAVAYRRIVGPIRSLTQVAEELAATDAAVLPHADAQDEIARLAYIIRTKLKQDELQRILASVSDALWSAESDEAGSLRYRYFSPVVERITGLLPEHFKPSPERWQEIVHPDDRPTFLHALRQAVGGESRREDVEYRIMRPDGAIRWVRDSIQATRLSDGRIVLSGVVSDITERKKIEGELRGRQEMLDLAQRVARAAAFDLDLTPGTSQRWPPAMEALHGLEPGTYDGTQTSWKKLIHPDDWPDVREAIRRARETGGFTCEYRVTYSDGSVHWLQSKGRFFFGSDKKPVRMVGIILDVSERHLAEVEMRRLEAQLRQAQRLEAMGTLAGGIAHDFNNILGAILGYGEMAARGVQPGTRLMRDLDSILAAGERGRALVERILAFSRSAVGERVPVHVENVVREALASIAATAPGNITLEAQLEAGNAAVIGDSTQVHQVLMNLATNAIQAMPMGGRLRIALQLVQFEAPRLFSTGKVDAGPYVALAVADSGAGIASDILERIFDPFFTTKEVGVGTGLGLSLVHSTVSHLGGAVDVSTALGVGSVFTVYLPHSGYAADAVETSIAELPTGNGQRVIVIDDEGALARLMAENLVSLGYSAVSFASSIEALHSIQAHPEEFDVLITDERMPGMSGSTLIEEVRQLRPDVPIIVVSGNVSPELVTRVRQAGANDLLKKPVLRRDLALIVARALEVIGSRRRLHDVRPNV